MPRVVEASAALSFENHMIKSYGLGLRLLGVDISMAFRI